jgi:hypothetical protein
VKAILPFEGISSQAKGISMLIVQCRADDKDFVVKFPNIPFSE